MIFLSDIEALALIWVGYTGGERKEPIVVFQADIGSPRRWPTVFLAFILVGLLLTVPFLLMPDLLPNPILSRLASRPVTASQLAAQSPYKNTRPGVKYLGDESCVHCHREIAETYRQHPMGHSLAPIAQARLSGGDERPGQPLFKAQGLEYSIERRDGRVIHQETQRDQAGRIVARNEADVQYILGSGRRGLGYLIERDGFLVQSPITWYSQSGRWELSPGYEDLNYHFDRPVQAGCLFCHTNRVELSNGALNRYVPPIFHGYGIGCERCHGPGELHVADPVMTNGKDLTIVNPKTLAPSLRDAVCEQCHLAGAQRVERVGLRAEDYRPGLALHRFWTVLVPASGQASSKFVGQVEQMHASHCFQASQGALGCISCHNPHQSPRQEERVSFYQHQCLQCHANRGCTLPRSDRLKQSKEDDCIACHMPRSKTYDIPHTAMTDHRILRQPEMEDTNSEKSHSIVSTKASRSSRRFLEPFHKNLMDARDLVDVKREIAIAYSRDGKEGAREALPWLESSLSAYPDDLPALQAKAVALGWLNRADEGLAIFKKVLSKGPMQELALKEAAQGATQAGQFKTALEYWQRAIIVNPWRSDYRAAPAKLYVEGHDWSSAVEACQVALRLNPANVQVRRWLVQCYLNLRNDKAAHAEMAILQAFSTAEGFGGSSGPSH